MVSYLTCTSRLVSVFLFNSLDLIFPLASLELWRKRCLSNHTRSPHNAGLFSWSYLFQVDVPWLGDVIDRTLDAGGMDAEMVRK